MPRRKTPLPKKPSAHVLLVAARRERREAREARKLQEAIDKALKQEAKVVKQQVKDNYALRKELRANRKEWGLKQKNLREGPVADRIEAHKETLEMSRRRADHLRELARQARGLASPDDPDSVKQAQRLAELYEVAEREHRSDVSRVSQLRALARRQEARAQEVRQSIRSMEVKVNY